MHRQMPVKFEAIEGRRAEKDQLGQNVHEETQQLTRKGSRKQRQIKHSFLIFVGGFFEFQVILNSHTISAIDNGK
jgi:hypothetical protein